MPTLTINGKDFPVGDNFMSMTPEQQGAYVDDLVKQGAAPAVTPAPSGPDPMPGSAAPAAPSPPRLSAREALNYPPPGSTNDIGQLLTTLGVRGAGSMLDFDPLSPVRRLISPTLERAEQTGKGAGQAAGDAFFKATGIPEYQPPDTGLGRTGMAAAQGATTGAPFGPAGTVIGALSGGLGQGATELLQGVLSPDNVERASTVASLAPAGYAALRRPSGGEVPSTAEIKAASERQFGAFRATPLDVDPTAVADLARQTKQFLQRDRGHREAFSPETFKILDEVMQTPRSPGGTPLMEPADIHSLRMQLNEVINENMGKLDGGNKQDVKSAAETIRRLDTFVNDLPNNPSHLLRGTTQDAQGMVNNFNEARGNYGQAMKVNDITGELDRANTGIAGKAAGRASATYSGSNFDNNVRQQVERILERPRDVRRLSDDELAALQHVRDGTWWGSNLVRRGANMLGGGGGLGATASGVGAASTAALSGASGGLTALAGAGAPVAGSLLKSYENFLAQRRLNQAADVMRQNSPLAQSQLTPRDIAVLRALMPGLLAPPPNTGGNYGGGGFLAP